MAKRLAKKKGVPIIEPPKNYSLEVRIYVDNAGGIRCASYTRPGRALTSFDTSLVVGALELAKASIIAGRWGVIDREDGSGRMISQRPASTVRAGNHVNPAREDAE